MEAKRVLRYLVKIKEYALTLSGGTMSLRAFADAEFAGDVATQLFTTELIVYFGDSPIL